ncbi:MAG TPA: hypothetical protein VFM58_16290 [Solirubrobacteraceae bacterium]|nr:hypothetical protein [Solirubrobacteraceae bacterium]
MLALFIALGGSAYAAAQLPSNSVGKAQIRSSAVGKSEVARNAVGKSEIRSSAIGKSEIATNGVGAAEIRTNAVGTKELRDGTIAVADLSPAALAANGVTFRVAVSDASALTSGNAKSATRTTDPGVYSVDLGADVSKCQVAATVAGTGATPGFVVVAPGASPNLLTVSTFKETAVADNRPFNLLVAC